MKKIALFITFLFYFNSFSQNIVINEIITSNSSVITDDDGSYEDWVELYNSGTESVNLSGFGLSDNVSLPYQWVFPEYWIQPGEQLLIWCSDKNRTNPLQPFHTNFKISSSGEPITLTDNFGNVVDSFPATIIPQNFSYGRQNDGSLTFVIFPEPTPGTSNITEGYSEILNPPIFSVTQDFIKIIYP